MSRFTYPGVVYLPSLRVGNVEFYNVRELPGASGHVEFYVAAHGILRDDALIQNNGKPVVMDRRAWESMVAAVGVKEAA